MSQQQSLVMVLEVVLLGAGRALKVDELVEMFADSALEADRAAIGKALEELGQVWSERGLDLVEVASGWRLQVGTDYAPWLARLWTERPARYSRALLETLALIAYRQPITRGEIEDVRGVSVSSSIIKTLLERDWVRALGHRDVPGRPAIYGTTRIFLDDFNLKGLEDLPPLADVRDIDRFHDDLFGETAAAESEDPPPESPEESASEESADAESVADSESADTNDGSEASTGAALAEVEPDVDVSVESDAADDEAPVSHNAATASGEPESEPGGDEAEPGMDTRNVHEIPTAKRQSS